MNNERIDITTMEARIRLWRAGDISDEDLALEMDYMVPELKRCYRVIEDIESMIPDNHEEIDPVLSDILSECHRLLGM